MVKMGNVWDRTTEFIGDNLAALWPIVLAGIFVPAAIVQALEPLRADAGGVATIALNGVQIVYILITVWAQLAVMALAIGDTDATGGAAARVGARRLPVVLGVGLLVLVAFMLLLVPILVVLVASGVDVTAMRQGSADLSAAALAAITVYAILLAPLTLFLFARLILTTPVLVGERRGLGAVARSWTLTRGIVFAVIGVLLLYALVAFIAQLAAKSVFGFFLELLIGGDGPLTLAKILTAIATATVATVFTVLRSAFIAKLYVGTRTTPDDRPARP